MQLSRDLSNYEHLVSDMFKWPETVDEWAKFKLTEEQLEFFNKNVYLSGIKLLEKWQV